MSDPRDIHELVGDDVPAPELEHLRRADEALRTTPAPPELSETLTAAVLAIPGAAPRRLGGARVLAGLAIAACIAGAAFGIGLWAGGTANEPMADQITLNATPYAPPEAKMVIAVLPIDSAGNWRMAADVKGLPRLAEGGYYEVWLTRGEELAASCGRFVVAENGTASDVWLNAPYKFKNFARWVVVAQLPGKPPSEHMLDGPVVVPA